MKGCRSKRYTLSRLAASVPPRSWNLSPTRASPVYGESGGLWHRLLRRRTMIADLAQNFVLGKDPGNINDIWNDFYYHTFWGQGRRRAIFYKLAASALEQALWDIKGKKPGIPVYEFFGGKRARRSARVYANDWATRACPPRGNGAKRV